MKFKAYYLDVLDNTIHPAEISIKNSFFDSIRILSDTNFIPDIDGLILPGFIDAHIHIESTMLTPAQFAKAALRHGTTSVIADPHEIANVLGIEGVDFMIENASKVPFDFYFSAPSCVPATVFETSGAILDSDDIYKLMSRDEIVALGEIMNFPGVIDDDFEVLSKINVARDLDKPIDGHAPLLSGKNLEKYLSKGISTDHECSRFNEAIEKKDKGMKIMVRDASSAKNLEALFDFSDRIEYWRNKDNFGYLPNEALERILEYPIFDFIVSDDKHVADIINGHLNESLKKAKRLELDIIELIKMVTLAPAMHYRLDSGAIMEGMKANFVVVDNLDDLNVKQTYVGGKLVFDGEDVLFDVPEISEINNFEVDYKTPEDFEVICESDKASVNVIKCFNGQLLTEKVECFLKSKNGILESNVDNDILKIANVERYGGNSLANGFIQGFNLKEGALASSISHDSHNILVVGVNSQDMAKAVNLVIENKGGIAVASKNYSDFLSLPVAGLMTNEDYGKVANKVEELERVLRLWGCKMDAPITTLSFMALLVIPSLKISNKGLFDGESFEFIDLIN
ncbi:MAG: adenine deaminase [Methanobrevibacter sp.]|uniref:adenine deaminase n=1 Tax=Methanobrevibacter sp. TaxID=66852 RepID=UPI0026DF0A6E|nr:adenine deaminase [Methanobrevibacter sp.]MDO5848276.1 adenine deaminase [Methanobrevibacter sp.]